MDLTSIYGTLTPLIVVAVIIALALAYIAIWSGRHVAIRVTALVLSIVFIPLAWFAFESLLSRPKFITIEKLRAEKKCIQVLHAEIKERVGVHMFVRFTPKEDPRYIFVPWNLKFAISLQKALRVQKLNPRGQLILGGKECRDNAGDGGGDEGKKGKGKLKLPGTSGGDGTASDGDFMYYPDPVPETPAKDLAPFYSPPLRMPDRQ